ncbi:hypothetical protein AFE02nite_27310 [Actinotalea fermentans]|uniref:Uncharacterized protein n=1 Tax=Actinotalea fermentans TaxID=43671 RepID=A0A511Z0K7_9CELL|nr:hypothetical protein AFE02nite_27310 [Actinotalea fermentans]
MVVLAWACAACGSDEPGGGASPTPPGDATTGAVDAFFDQMDALRDMGDAIDQHTAVQEDVAACMNALGFEYTPLDPGPALEDVRTATDLGLEPGTREYAEQFGFGITTDDMGYYAMSAAQLDDPNTRYVEQLSPEARAEYDRALWGSPEEVDAADPQSGEGQGCFAQAQASAGAMLEASGEFDPDVFFQEQMAMREAIQSDDRVVGLHPAWASCMADAGFPGLVTPGDNLFTGDAMLAIRTEFDARLVALQGAITDVDDPSIKLGLAALQAKQELAEREIAMAVADVDCRDSSGYADALLEVEIEYQAQFYADHKAEFDAYADAVAERAAADADD